MKKAYAQKNVTRNIFSDLFLSVSSNDEGSDATAENELLSSKHDILNNIPSPIIVDLTDDGPDDKQCCEQLPKKYTDVKPILSIWDNFDMNKESYGNCSPRNEQDGTLDTHTNQINLSPNVLSDFIETDIKPLNLLDEFTDTNEKSLTILKPSELEIIKCSQSEIASRLKKYAPSSQNLPVEESSDHDDDTDWMNLFVSTSQVGNMSIASDDELSNEYGVSSNDTFTRLEFSSSNLKRKYSMTVPDDCQTSKLNNDISENVFKMPKKLFNGLKAPLLEEVYVEQSPIEKYPSRITLESPFPISIGKVCTKASVRREISKLPEVTNRNAPPLSKVKASMIRESDSFQEAQLRSLKVVVSKIDISGIIEAPMECNASCSSSLSVSHTHNREPDSLLDKTNKQEVIRRPSRRLSVARKHTFRENSAHRKPPRMIKEIENTNGFIADQKKSLKSREDKALSLMIERISGKSSKKDASSIADSSVETTSTCSTIEFKEHLNTVADHLEDIFQQEVAKKPKTRKPLSLEVQSTEINENQAPVIQKKRKVKKKKLSTSKYYQAAHNIKQKYSQARRQCTVSSGLHPRVQKCLEMKKEDSSLNPLHLAASLGHQASVQYCLSHMPHMIHDRDSLGRIPLHLSAYNNHVSVSKLLLEVGSDANAASLEDGRRPIHEAIMNGGSLSLVQILVEGGADPDFYMYSGKSSTTLTKDPDILQYLKLSQTVTPPETRDYEFDLRRNRLPTVFTLRKSTSCDQCKNYVLAKDISRALGLSYPTFVNRYSARITLISSNFTDLRRRFVSDVDTRCENLGESFEAIASNDCDFLLVEYDDRVRDLLHANRFSVTNEEASNESTFFNALDPYRLKELDNSPINISSNETSFSNEISPQASRQSTPNNSNRPLSESASKVSTPELHCENLHLRRQSSDISSTSTNEDWNDANTDNCDLRSEYAERDHTEFDSRISFSSDYTICSTRPTSDHTYAFDIADNISHIKILELLGRGCRRLMKLVIQWRNEVYLLVKRIAGVITKDRSPTLDTKQQLILQIRRLVFIIKTRLSTYEQHYVNLKFFYDIEMRTSRLDGEQKSPIWNEFVTSVLEDHLVIVKEHYIISSECLKALNLNKSENVGSFMRELKFVDKHFLLDCATVTDCESMFLSEVERLIPLVSDVDWDNEDSSAPPSPDLPDEPSVISSSSIPANTQISSSESVHEIASSVSLKGEVPLTQEAETLPCFEKIPVEHEVIVLRSRSPSPILSLPVQEQESEDTPHSKDCTSCAFCKRLRKLETSCQAVLQSNINGQNRSPKFIPPPLILPSDFIFPTKKMSYNPLSSTHDQINLGNASTSNVWSGETDVSHEYRPGTTVAFTEAQSSTIDLTSDSD